MKQENRDLFGEEEVLTGHLKEVGRLDKERELYRLVNILNDSLIKYSGLSSTKVEKSYSDIKRMLEIEYYKTVISELEDIEMYVWHLSLFTCLDRFQTTLQSKTYEDPQEVVSDFQDILRENFTEYLSELSERNELDHIGDKLQQPGQFEVEEQTVLYWLSYHSKVFTETGGSDRVKKYDDWEVSVERGPEIVMEREPTPPVIEETV